MENFGLNMEFNYHVHVCLVPGPENSVLPLAAFTKNQPTGESQCRCCTSSAVTRVDSRYQQDSEDISM